MDIKIGQVEKLIKAKRDSSFSEAARLMDLDPEQAAYQAKLRKATQVRKYYLFLSKDNLQICNRMRKDKLNG